jgi:hypothetical protein
MRGIVRDSPLMPFNPARVSRACSRSVDQEVNLAHLPIVGLHPYLGSAHF